MIRSNVQRQLLDADLAVRVDLSGYDAGDYQKALEIIALGEEAAKGMLDEFGTLRSELGSLPDYTPDLYGEDPTPILRVTVEGADRTDRDRVHALFAPFVGEALAASELEEAVAVLEATGSYEYVRVRRTVEEPTPTLPVTLQKREAPGHSLRLGMDHSSTYSGSSVNAAGISPSVVFRNLITEDSRLTVNARILDSPALELIALQPLGVSLFVEGFLKARQESETYVGDLTGTSLDQTGIIETGVNLGINPVPWAEIAAGVRYQWTHAAQGPIIPAGVTNRMGVARECPHLGLSTRLPDIPGQRLLNPVML